MEINKLNLAWNGFFLNLCATGVGSRLIVSKNECCRPDEKMCVWMHILLDLLRRLYELWALWTESVSFIERTAEAQTGKLFFFSLWKWQMYWFSPIETHLWQEWFGKDFLHGDFRPSILPSLSEWINLFHVHVWLVESSNTLPRSLYFISNHWHSIVPIISILFNEATKNKNSQTIRHIHTHAHTHAKVLSRHYKMGPTNIPQFPVRRQHTHSSSQIKRKIKNRSKEAEKKRALYWVAGYKRHTWTVR